MGYLIMGVIAGLLFFNVKGVLYKIIIVLSAVLVLLLNVTAPENESVQVDREREDIRKTMNGKCYEYAENAKNIMELRQKGLHKHIIRQMTEASSYKGSMADVDLFLNDAFSYPIIQMPETNHLGDHSGSELYEYVIKVEEVKERFFEIYYNKCVGK